VNLVHRPPREEEHDGERDTRQHGPRELDCAPTGGRARHAFLTCDLKRSGLANDDGSNDRRLGDRTTRDSDPEDRVSGRGNHCEIRLEERCKDR
jgi:hypothetical protein